MRLRPPDGWRAQGIFVGGCVERGEGSSFRAQAHAHTNPRTAHAGWICVRSLKRIGEYVASADAAFDGEITRPSTLLWHEETHHHLPYGVGHGARFAAKMRDLCGYVDCAPLRKGGMWFRKRRTRIYPPERKPALINAEKGVVS